MSIHHIQGGITFEVLTDYHALKVLLSLNDPKGVFIGWMIKTQGLNLNVEGYCPIFQLGKESASFTE